MINVKPNKLVLATALAFTVTSCGGGGGGESTTPTPPPVQPPTPSISGSPILTISENEAYAFAVSTSNLTGSVEFSATNLPDWLTINETSGEVSGTPLFDDAGEYPDIEIMASNGTDSVSLPPFSIDVTDTFALQGKVIDGYVQGAVVFLDVNADMVLDEGEPSTITDQTGSYNLPIPAELLAQLAQTPLRAVLGETAVDVDRPEIDYSETPIVLSTFPVIDADLDIATYSNAFITPFTNKVFEQIVGELAQLVEGSLIQEAFNNLVAQTKGEVLIEAFDDIGVDVLDTALDIEVLTQDLFTDFTQAQSNGIPISFRHSIVELAGELTDIVIEEQDVRDFDNDGIANNIDDDDDGDGILDEHDAFRFDAEESADSDGDGIGDNADFYPTDSACNLESQGNGEYCFTTWLADQEIETVIKSNSNVYYYFNSQWDSILAFNADDTLFYPPITVSEATAISYSGAHDKVYVGFNDGNIQSLDASRQLVDFANVGSVVRTILEVGEHISVIHSSGSYNTAHSLIDENGVLLDEASHYTYVSRDYTYNPADARIYYFRDGLSPNDLMYIGIDFEEGRFTDAGETPYHGDYSIMPPITVSNNGTHVMLGSGDIYQTSDLTWSKSVSAHSLAWWNENDEIFTISTTEQSSVINGRNSDNQVVDSIEIRGEILEVFASEDNVNYVIKDQGRVYVRQYVVNNDHDNDGVINAEDAFPFDVAASVDSDFDGFPDSWNDGYTIYDSSTGLSLDEFPQDSACWLAQHGNGSVCDYGATVPNFTPDHVTYDQFGNIYFLSIEHKKVYRWLAATNYYTNPIALSSLVDLSDVNPSTIAYAKHQQRLYVGYVNGAITYVDLTTLAPEQSLAYTASRVNGLADAGNFILAQDDSGAWDSFYIFDTDGELTASIDWQTRSQTYAWHEDLSRLYFLWDRSTRDSLNYLEINQVTGLITRNEGKNIARERHPLRLSQDNSQIVLGNGAIYESESMELVGQLENDDFTYFTDVQLLGEYGVSAEFAEDNYIGRVWSVESQEKLMHFDISGQTLAIVPTNDDVQIVSKVTNGLEVIIFEVGDSDNDGLPGWWENNYDLSDSDANDALLDNDQDGLSNLAEFENGTNPLVTDTDGDGLSDSAEVNTHGTSPLLADSDGDGLTDSQEINEYNTDPLSVDSDNDGLSDYAEVNEHQTNPLSADTDNDGLSDLYEIAQGLDPNVSDSGADTDTDGLTNLEEFEQQTDPNNPDSDGDGLNDGDEVNVHQSEPLNPDTDGDRMRDGFEVNYGLSVLSASDASDDNDEDGFDNVEEYFLSTSPIDEADIPAVGRWAMYQGDAGHTGFFPVYIDVDDINLRWQVAITAQATQAIGDDKLVFVAQASNRVSQLTAFNALTGAEEWYYPTNNSTRLTTPAVNNDKVYLQNAASQPSIRAINQADGSLFYRHSLENNYNQIRALTVFDETVYASTENYVTAVNTNGESDWTSNIDYYVNSHGGAAVNDNYVYLNHAGLLAIDRETGEQAFVIAESDDGSSSSRLYNTPVIGFNDNVLIAEGQLLTNYSTTNRAQLWQKSLSENYNARQISVAYGHVYVVQGSLLSVYSEETGDLVWSWEVPDSNTIRSDVLVVRNLAFVSTYNATYAIDLSTRLVSWQTNHFGQLSISDKGALFITNTEYLATYNISGDADNDGMPDWWEESYGFDMDDATDAALDADSDGLTNLEEFNSTTDPLVSDTDGDGLSDGDEVNTHSTSPIEVDSDQDGLSDGEEVLTHGSDPLATDTDQDGLSDYDEVNTHNSNPLSSDTDNDGMSDAWEVEHGLDINADDTALDTDEDGLNNLEELNEGTDPNIADTDNDGLLDGVEVNTHLTNPNNKDSDNDSMFDGWEVTYSFDPNDAADGTIDSDSDDFANYEEFYLQTNPLDGQSFAENQPWITYQANAKHNGFVVQKVLVDNIEQLWQVDIGLSLHQVVAADGKVFMTNSSYFNSQTARAYNSSSGNLLWQHDYDGIHSINPPAYADGQVFYHTGGHQDSFIRGVNANTGEINFASSYGNQWDRYLAPTPFGDDVYFNGGYYGGMYGFTNTGEEKFFIGLESYDGWTPSVDEEQVYAYNGPQLNVYDRHTGELNYSIAYEGFNWHGWTTSGAGVLGEANNLVTVERGNLISFDLENRRVGWVKSSGYIQEPAIAYGRIYAIQNGTLTALEEETGDLLWSFEAPSGSSFTSNIAITRNIIFVGTGSHTYAIDISTRQVVWQTTVVGQITVSQGVLYIAGSLLTAFNIGGDNDEDGLPNWFEINNGLNPDDASDAELDADNDGLTNVQEYDLGTQLNVADSDSDGLSDGDEVNAHSTDPLNSDSDNDGLTDGDEVNTHSTDPLLIDTDGDSFSDYDEINQYETDPNDSDSKPDSITSYVESFEADTTPIGWSEPDSSDNVWFVSEDWSSEGEKSLRSGVIGNNQSSDVSYSSLFSAGTFSFDALVSSESCCDRLYVYLNDEVVVTISNGESARYELDIPSGQHTIRFSYRKDGSASSGTDSASIDNVLFEAN